MLRTMGAACCCARAEEAAPRGPAASADALVPVVPTAEPKPAAEPPPASGPAPASAAEPPLAFDAVHAAVVAEIEAHADVWVRERKDLEAVVARFRALRGRVPMMRLVHGSTLAQLGRIPRSDELGADGAPYWRPLDEVHAAWEARPIEGDAAGRRYARLNVAFLSHRWTRPAEGRPDDASGSKAQIVRALTQYGRSVYAHDSWWWIDWTCADQQHTAGHIAALPLYIAASTELVSVYPPGTDYDRRGWIRCERALGAALNSPRAWKMVPPEEFARLRAVGAAPAQTEWWTLDDPALGEASVEADRAYLAALSALALRLWPVGYAANWHAESNQYADWGYEPRLEYGKTRIFTWCMNYYSGLGAEEA